MLTSSPSPAAMADPEYGQEQDAYCAGVAAKIRATWEHQGSADLALCLERMRQQVLSDRVAFLLNVGAARENGNVILTGEVERPEFREITRGVSRHLGFTSVVDRLEVVPEAGAEPFGVTVAPRAMTWSQPDLTGVAMDEALYGEPVYLLKELPQAWLIKNATGYWGYARKGDIQRVSRAAFIRLLNSPKAMLARDYTVAASVLPAGCRLAIRAWGEGDTCTLEGPLGEPLAVPKDLCLRNRRAEDLRTVIATARQFLGAPYQMGGRNRETGIDCSGLIQLSFQSIGLKLPRDAKQQYLGGDLILPCVEQALQPGDVLFFISKAGQVHHTGLYLGNGELIHAVMPCVQIQSLNPGSTNYLKRYAHEFIGAKRFCW